MLLTTCNVAVLFYLLCVKFLLGQIQCVHFHLDEGMELLQGCFRTLEVPLRLPYKDYKDGRKLLLG